MKDGILLLVIALLLSAAATQAAEDARFCGGGYDGWDLNDMNSYEGLGSAAVVSLSSGTDQVFDWTQASAALAPLTIDVEEPDGWITNGGTLRIALLPAGWPCRFDTTAAVAYGGSAAGKVGAASFLDDGRTLLIPVTSDFVATDTLTVSGLMLTDLWLVSAGTRRLALDFTGEGVPDRYDPYTVAVRVPWRGGSYDGWDANDSTGYVSVAPPTGAIMVIR